jgi:hypothetical protein
MQKFDKSRIAAAIVIVLIATSMGVIAIPAQAALSGTPGGTPSTY